MTKNLILSTLFATLFIGQAGAMTIDAETRETLFRAQEKAETMLDESAFSKHGAVVVCLEGKASLYKAGVAKYICSNILDSYVVTLKTNIQLGGSLTAKLDMLYFSTGKKRDNGEYCYRAGTVGFAYGAGGSVAGGIENACSDTDKDELGLPGVFFQIGAGVGVAGELGLDFISVKRL